MAAVARREAPAVKASSSSRMGRSMQISFNVRRILGVLIILSFLVFIAEASDSSTVNYNTNQSITAFSTCKKVTNGSGTGLNVYVPTQSAAEWASFYSNPPAGITISSCATNIIVPSGANLDLCTLAGNPTTPGNYVFTVDSGTIINSSSTSTPALITGTCWPAGSSITLINNGAIYGRGGDGGSVDQSTTRKAICNGNGGGSGGSALGMAYPITIDNTNGYILGGGGGGGGAGAVHQQGWCYMGGGGGGGGQGSVDSSGGRGGNSNGNGGTGTASEPGTGGPGVFLGGSRGCDGPGGAGGLSGGSGASGSSCTNGAAHASGGSGGPGGGAITGASYGIIWLGGNDATHVQGAVQ